MTKRSRAAIRQLTHFFSYKTNRVLLKEHRYDMRIKPIDLVGEK